MGEQARGRPSTDPIPRGYERQVVLLSLYHYLLRHSDPGAQVLGEE